MRKSISIALLLFPVMLFGCSGEEEPAARQAARTAASATATSATATAAPSARIAMQSAVTIRTADGTDLLTLAEAEGVVQLTYTEAGARHTIRGATRDTGKRKYTLETGGVSYEIKPGDGNSFKLRNPDGSLRWKVKVSGDKIKISDNEENANPFELKDRGDRTKVVAPGERDLGAVRCDRTASKCEIETAGGVTRYVVQGSSPSGGFGVLLLDTIPVAERYILLAEIRSRGR